MSVSRWVLERTALEASLPPYWTQCGKQSLLQMSSISLEKRRLRCHSGLILSQVLFFQHFFLLSDALYLATRGSAKLLCKESELGLLEGGAVADFLLVDMNGEQNIFYHSIPLGSTTLRQSDTKTASTYIQYLRKSPLDFAGHDNTRLFGHESAEDIVHKFVFLSDDRNIKQVWVNGQKVKDTDVPQC